MKVTKEEVQELLANAEHNGYPKDLEKEDLFNLAMEFIEYGGLPEGTDIDSIVEALEEIKLENNS